jgi:hypothetical protein
MGQNYYKFLIKPFEKYSEEEGRQKRVEILRGASIIPFETEHRNMGLNKAVVENRFVSVENRFVSEWHIRCMHQTVSEKLSLALSLSLYIYIYIYLCFHFF